jgi:Uma2 family endonuclease
MNMPPRYTYSDYKKFEGDWELIDGFLWAIASPFGRHQRVMAYLIKEILDELEDCECEVYPELDYIIDDRNVLRPDLAIYCEEIEEYPKTTPKVVIEIVSSSTATRDEEVKFKIYEKEKVEYYVLVYPDLGKVRIFKLKDGKFEKVYEGDKEFKFDLCEMEIDFKRVL